MKMDWLKTARAPTLRVGLRTEAAHSSRRVERKEATRATKAEVRSWALKKAQLRDLTRVVAATRALRRVLARARASCSARARLRRALQATLERGSLAIERERVVRERTVEQTVKELKE